MDLRKWERVFDAAKAELCFNGQYLWYDDWKKAWLIGNDYLQDEAVAAIIRDWAVWWLAEQMNARTSHSFAIDIFPPVLSVRACAREWDDRSAPRLLDDWAKDRTEALYLACCKVLGIEP